jgi:exopolyphosphatase/pppGpp-phosphohydrolase
VAVIEITDDGLELAVFEQSCERPPKITKVLDRSVTLAQGDSGARTPQPDTITALREALGKYVKLARREARQVAIAASQVTRRVPGETEMFADLAASAGEPIRILTPGRRAQLGFLGTRHRLKPFGCQVLIDSGAGSTELTITQGREYVAGLSLPINAALLSEALEGDPPSPLSWALSAIQMGTVLRDLPQLRPTRAWATGASSHYLAGLDGAQSGRPSRTMRMTDLEELTRQLLKRPSRVVGAKRGQDPRRVTQLPAGALILGAVLQYYHLDRCTVLAEGMHEGIALAALEDPLSWWQSRTEV